MFSLANDEIVRTHCGVNRLRDTALLRKNGYIGGRWVSGALTFDVHDPASGRPIASVASLGPREAGDAIYAAESSLRAWKARPAQQRSRILRAWFDLVTLAREDLALILTLEQGKPLSESLGEIDYAASFIEWYAEEGKRLNVESVTSHLPGTEMVVRREAIGVAALLTPWNFPSAMLTRKAAAALAAGCTVVCHPSSQAPLSTLALAELADRAGVPAGVFNVVTGMSEPIVNTFCDDPRVRIVSFTGSTQIGRKIAARCASTMKRLVMELGGHAPLIVFDDAGIERAIAIAMAAKFTTSGQDCLAANRIYVQRNIYAAFCAAFAERIAALKVGNGLDEGVQVGPLIHNAAVAKARAHLADALRRGARCLTGGESGTNGLFVQPALLVDVPDDALVMIEETFAPIAAVTPFDTEEEVIARANATEYGLVAYVVTDNFARALRLGRNLEYGMVAVNRARITGAPVPFGGIKQSGLGREGSRHGLEAFTEIKYLCLDFAWTDS